MIRRQILMISGDSIWADVMLDWRSMTRAQCDSHRGWTYSMGELRKLAESVRVAPGPVTIVEVIHHPERRRFDGRRTRLAVTYCRILFTISETRAAEAA